ncbi:MAG: hypothetical protein WA040_21570 [Anaerolineae bacterium]
MMTSSDDRVNGLDGLAPVGEDTMCGHHDPNELAPSDAQRLRREIELEILLGSADLYAEVYRKDHDLQALTEAAIEGWPE